MKRPTTAKNGRMKHIVSKSPEETQRFGREWAKSLPVPGIVLLYGALGTGKTTLARGIAEGLGLGDPHRVSSPSFTLVNIYQGSCPIYHVDLYRLHGERDLYLTGIDDFMGREGVTIVEWGERLGYVPANAAIIEMEDGGDDIRILHILARLSGRNDSNTSGDS
jgi:tRNA threonylcarbamoyladenosine biosynthesis protein TsaE